jgi:alpha-maltose-1-phosphate synthase
MFNKPDYALNEPTLSSPRYGIEQGENVMMQVAHVLRKYDPREWGGTETAVKRLCDGLRVQEVKSIAFCPRITGVVRTDPLRAAGHRVKRFKGIVPVWGIGPEQKRALVQMGGNLISFDLISKLLNEPDINLIHAHTQNRLGGTALAIAQLRGIPLVVSIHGGVLDLPESAKAHLAEPLRGGFEWGRFFGALVRSRKVLEKADAILTCNRNEARLLKEKYPKQRIVVQPHGIPADDYAEDHRADALAAFPEIVGKRVLLMLGRIDTVKNQSWIVEQAPCIFQRFPDTVLVMAGASTDDTYLARIKNTIQQLGLQNHIIMTGGLPPGDRRLIGLLQQATVLLLPSISEPFGLVILESWASGTPVISSRTSGATDLIQHRENGWLFDLTDANGFHQSLHEALSKPQATKRAGELGRERVRAHFDSVIVAGQVKRLYEELIENKIGVRPSSGTAISERRNHSEVAAPENERTPVVMEGRA